MTNILSISLNSLWSVRIQILWKLLRVYIWTRRDLRAT